MSIKKSVPEIRFKGFSGAWVEKLLFEVAEKISVGIATSSSKHFVSLSSGVPFIKNQDIKNGVIDTKNLEAISNEFDNANKNKRLKTGDILTVRTGYPGLSAVLPMSLNNAQSFTTLITRIKSKEVNPFFVSTYINSDSGKRQMNGMQAGGAQQNINANTLKNFAIYYPNLLEEQTAIGNTFQKLDNLINQHQQKHDKLSNIKKAMLEKMFPKQGETIPEIRFKGFSGEWQEKELKEICTYHSSTLTVNDAEAEGKYELYDAQKCIGYTDRNIQDSDYITIIKDGSGVGRVRVLPKNSSFIATMGAIKPDESNLHFLYGCFIKIDFNKHISGATIPHVYFRDYGREKFRVPTIEEQTSIGNYFQKLDALIKQHQQQITKLNNIKQACLSKMFV